MVRTVFWGSSDSVFSNRHFQALMEADCSVVAIVDVPPARRASTNSQRQSSESFLETARKNGIPCFAPARPNAQHFVAEIRALSPDLFVAVGYMLLLGPSLLSVPRVIAVNFHASLLPAYRGKHPVFWALRNGDLSCGLTVHEMSPGLDTGDIIFQVRVPVRQTDCVSTVYDRIMSASVPLVPGLIAAVTEGNIPRTPQPSEGASYFGATSENDFRITWSMEPALIERWVTTTPGQCFVEIAGQRLFLLDAKDSRNISLDREGTLLDLSALSCRIAVSGGAIEIHRVRTADGAEMTAYDALCRRGAAQGAILGGH